MTYPPKKLLRIQFKKIRDSLPANFQRTASRKIKKHLFGFPELKKAKTVAVYISKGSEVRTFEIIQKLLKIKKTVAAPKTHQKKVELTFHVVKNLKECVLGAFNILEPSSKCAKIPLSKIDLILVPGIVFDRRGMRLGYGKGYYDRLLKKFNPFSVGLTYEKNLIRRIPSAHNDVPVSCIITEKKVYPHTNFPIRVIGVGVNRPK